MNLVHPSQKQQFVFIQNKMLKTDECFTSILVATVKHAICSFLHCWHSATMQHHKLRWLTHSPFKASFASTSGLEVHSMLLHRRGGGFVGSRLSNLSFTNDDVTQIEGSLRTCMKERWLISMSLLVCVGFRCAHGIFEMRWNCSWKKTWLEHWLF